MHEHLKDTYTATVDPGPYDECDIKKKGKFYYQASDSDLYSCTFGYMHIRMGGWYL